MTAPWRATADGAIVVCRLTPRGGRDAVEGIATLADGAVVLTVRVRVAPEDGRANASLCRLIAEAAGAPASRARVAAGVKSRIKQVAVAGDPAALIAALTGSLAVFDKIALSRRPRESGVSGATRGGLPPGSSLSRG